MRLTAFDKEQIILAVQSVLDQHHLSIGGVALYLYGSRTQDNLKGGDIDLLLRVPTSQLKKISNLNIPFLVEIKKRIGDQKIDLLIISQEPPQEPFHQIAVEQAVPLKAW